MIVINETN